MRTTAAVDDLILWLAAGILALFWLGIAGASFGAYLKQTDVHLLAAQPIACTADAASTCPSRSSL
jgi:hypothetical protein